MGSKFIERKFPKLHPLINALTKNGLFISMAGAVTIQSFIHSYLITKGSSTLGVAGNLVYMTIGLVLTLKFGFSYYIGERLLTAVNKHFGNIKTTLEKAVKAPTWKEMLFPKLYVKRLEEQEPK